MRSLVAAAALLSIAAAPALSAESALQACPRPKVDARPLPVFPVTLVPGTQVRLGPSEAAAKALVATARRPWFVVDLCGPWALVTRGDDAAGYVPIASVRPNGRPLARGAADRFLKAAGLAGPQVWQLGPVPR